MPAKKLTIVPAVPIWVDRNLIIFDRKFYEGMLMYVEAWNGVVGCVLRKTVKPLPLFGLVEKRLQELPFDLEILSEKEAIIDKHVIDSSVLLAAGDSFDQFHLSKLCKNSNIKCVYTIEYTPETRKHILNLENLNFMIKARRNFFLWNGERKRLSAFLAADGIQANGVPAFEKYNRFDNCILYFDTRVKKQDIVNPQELEDRFKILESKAPLRLAFSGRLIKMKGADHLIKLAALLKAKGVNFTLTIYGAGNLDGSMKNEIQQLGLGNRVTMAGAVDFYRELIPSIKANIDLYIILHKQSDPSCTYLETLSCGIPIVGYENSAFLGFLDRSDIGWGKKINDLEGVATVIEYLSRHPEEIKKKSMNSVNFALANDFEAVFKKRIKQLKDIVK